MLNNENFKNAVFDSLLDKKSWQYKKALYKDCFDYAAPFRHLDSPAISIIVISWRLHPDNLKNFQILEEQRGQNFELIFVDNGGKEGEFDVLKPYIDVYVKLNKNTGAYLARNIGSVFAQAPILFFLEDDGIPEHNLVEAHLKLFKKYDIIACRGPYIPKTDNPLNKMQNHYYIGDKEYPTFAHIEGNTSYLAETFYKVGGWDDEIRFGGGGLDLYFRLLTIEPDKRKQIYSPSPVIYHDYVSDEKHLDEKRKRQGKSFERLRKKHPEWDLVNNNYRMSFDRYDLLIRKDSDPTSLEKSKPSKMISICVLASNSNDGLIKTIASICGQDLYDTEIFIACNRIDSGIGQIIGKYPININLIEFDSQHPVYVKNQMIQKVNGEYILWIESGIEFTSHNSISSFKEEIKEHFDVDIFYSNSLLVNRDDKIIKNAPYKNWYSKNDELANALNEGESIPFDCYLIRKNLYNLVGSYDQDTDFEINFLKNLVSKKNYNLKLTDKALYKKYGQNNYYARLLQIIKQVCKNHFPRITKNIIKIHNSLAYLFKKHQD